MTADGTKGAEPTEPSPLTWTRIVKSRAGVGWMGQVHADRVGDQPNRKPTSIPEPGAAPAEPDATTDDNPEATRWHAKAYCQQELREQAGAALAEARAEIERLRTESEVHTAEYCDGRLKSLETAARFREESACLRKRVRELEAALHGIYKLLGTFAGTEWTDSVNLCIDVINRALASTPAPAEPTPPSSGAEPEAEYRRIVRIAAGYQEGAPMGATPCPHEHACNICLTAKGTCCRHCNHAPCPETAAHGVHACVLPAGHDGDCQWDTGATPEDIPACYGVCPVEDDDGNPTGQWWAEADIDSNVVDSREKAIAQANAHRDRVTADATAELRRQLAALDRENSRLAELAEPDGECSGCGGNGHTCINCDTDWCRKCWLSKGHLEQCDGASGDANATAELRAERDSWREKSELGDHEVEYQAQRAKKAESERDTLASKLAEAEGLLSTSGGQKRLRIRVTRSGRAVINRMRELMGWSR